MKTQKYFKTMKVTKIMKTKSEFELCALNVNEMLLEFVIIKLLFE